MNLARLAILSFVLLLAGCDEADTRIDPPTHPAEAAVAQLASVEGAVQLTRKAIRTPAVVGPVFQGDLIETEAGGRAVLSSPETRIELSPESQFQVKGSLRDLALTVGQIAFEDSATNPYDTPVGRVRPGPATKVQVKVTSEGASLRVETGTLEFVEVNADGGVETLKAGDRFVAKVGKIAFEDDAVAPRAQVNRPPIQLGARGKVIISSKSHGKRAVPETGLQLDETAQFSVAREGQLEVARGETRVEFDSASQGVVDPTPEGISLETTISTGKGRIFVAPGDAIRLGGKKPAIVRSQKGATMWLAATKKGTQLDVVGGAIDFEPDGDTASRIIENEAIFIDGHGAMSRRKSPASVISLPAAKAVDVFWKREENVTLQFEPGPGLAEVATDPQFENRVLVADVADAVSIPAPRQGQLFWRRRGGSAISSARFRRDDEAGQAGAKSDTIRETGLKATVLFQSAVPTLTFVFSPRINASSYKFRLYDTQNLQEPIVDRSVAEDRIVLESGRLREGSYVWSAVGMNQNGQEERGGRMNKVDIVFDNAVSRLVIQGAQRGEASTHVAGVAPKSSRLFFNGKAVQTDAYGRFSVATGGAQLLTFRLVDRSGHESLWVRRVLK